MALLVSLCLPAAALAATYTVDSTGDVTDPVPGDCVCDNGSGACTLRAAIATTNACAGTDAIEFSISTGPQTISPATSLVITEAVTIAGWTQPGATEGDLWAGTPHTWAITIAGSGGTGFQVNASDVTIQGLNIESFTTAVNVAVGADDVTLSGLRFEDNSTAVSLNGNGATVTDSVFVDNAETINATAGTEDTSVTESFFGVEADGTTVNKNSGGATISSEVGLVDHCIFVGFDTGAATSALTIVGDSVVVKRNRFGADLDSTSVPNSIHILIRQQADDAVIGGASGDGNTIDDADVDGVFVDGGDDIEISYNHIYGCEYGIYAQNASLRLVIHHNDIQYSTHRGVDLIGGSDGAHIYANTIANNAQAAILLADCDDTTIGGTTSAYRNYIYAGSSFAPGIEIVDGSRTTIRTNWVGVNAGGNAAGNAGAGIEIDAGDDNVIQDCVVSANGGSGIKIASGVTDTTIQDSYIGTNAAGVDEEGFCNAEPQIDDAGTNTTETGNTMGDCTPEPPAAGCCGCEPNGFGLLCVGNENPDKPFDVEGQDTCDALAGFIGVACTYYANTCDPSSEGGEFDGTCGPPGPTNTPTATVTTTSGPTFTPTVTPTATPTALPTFTPLPTYTPYPTYTPEPTCVPYPTFTETGTFTPTRTPTITHTFTVTPTATRTFTPCSAATAVCDNGTPTRTRTPIPTRSPVSFGYDFDSPGSGYDFDSPVPDLDF